MKHTYLLPTVVILLVWLVSADAAAATQPPSIVEITNRSGVKRRICMYRVGTTARTSPSKCFVIDANKSVVWNRQGNRSAFLMRVFASGRVLHERWARAGANRVLMRSSGIYAFYDPPKGSQQ